MDCYEEYTLYEKVIADNVVAQCEIKSNVMRYLIVIDGIESLVNYSFYSNLNYPEKRYKVKSLLDKDFKTYHMRVEVA